MLSIVDIKKELGDNLYIYPIHSDSIKGNSVDFHASKFGWSMKTKRKILSPDEQYLLIPPNDTALIYTEESIYVSPKIGGTCHSKVTLVCMGLGHLGTTLDPQYIGSLLIAIHNHSDEVYSLKVGAEFISLVFHYLTSSDYIDTRVNDNDPGHPRMIIKYEDSDKYIEWRDQNKWTVQQNILYTKMIQSEEYKKCKQDFEEEQIKFNRKLLKNRSKKYIISLFISLFILLLFAIPSYILSLGSISIIFANLTEKILLPLLLAIISGLVIVDLKK